MSPLRGVLIGLTLLALAALIWVCVFGGAPTIEASLQSQARAALTANAYAGNLVEMDGRDARLRGRVADAESARAVVALVSGVTGVRTVADDLEIDPPAVDTPTAELPTTEPAAPETPTGDATPAATGDDGTEPPTPEATEPPSDDAAAQEAFDAVLSTSDIEFETGSAVIGTAGAEVVDELAAILLRYPGTRVRVEGHTDSVGNDDDNLTLSEERARAVVRALVARGIDTGRLVPVGYGETVPIDDNATPEGRRRNRRVAFVVVEEN